MKLLLLITLGVIAALAEETQVLKDYKVGYTQFTANVYKELLKSHSGNFLVCPLSVHVILGLVYDGAQGKTAQQLSTGLHLPENKETTRQIFRELAPYLQGNDKYNLTSANKVYIKNGFKIKDQFKNTAVDVFDAEIQNIDFEKSAEAAAEMNRWVEEKTDNKINNVIQKDDLNEYTRAILINAMYFHGKWVKKFEVENTKKETFHLSSKEQTKVDLMEITEQFGYYESSELNAKFLELPYQGGEVTMTFVLPNDVEGLAALEAHIADVLVAPNYNFEKVHVKVPKFKIETTIKFNPILKALGITDAFEDYANFEDISIKPLKISKVVQKAFIEVEEKGTTAAAATAVIMEDTRSAHFDFPPQQFIADHPFIYYLKSSAGIMFIGRYVRN